MVTFYKPKAPTLNKTALEVECIDLDLQGRGVAKDKDKIWFINNLLPGEKAKVIPVSLKGKIGEAKVCKYLSTSNLRIKPQCECSQNCGGCPLDYVEPKALLDYKVKGLYKLLSKISKDIKDTPDFVVPSATENYRRVCRLAVRIDHGKVLLGFREGKSQKLVTFKECSVLTPRINKAIPEITEVLNRLEKKKNLGHVEFVDSDGALGIYIRFTATLNDKDKEILKEFSQTYDYVLSIGEPYQHEVDKKELVKESFISDNASNLFVNAKDCHIVCKPTAFIQINKQVNDDLISLVLNYLKPNSSMKILDLFCGIGNFTLPLAKTGAEVFGVDIVSSMINDAKENAKFNNLDTVNFAVADLEDEFEKQQWAKRQYDAVVLDPGRQGAKMATLFVAKLKVPQIVMISCNPLAASRDLAELLKAGYKIKAWGALDMFPRTAHVEMVTVLSNI